METVNIGEMSFIFKLGKYVLMPVLAEWLVLEDFVVFDCAVSGNDQRNLLFGFYSEFSANFHFFFFRRCALPLSMTMIDWFNTRQLGSVSKICATNSMLLKLDFVKQGSISNMLSYLNSISLGSSSFDVSKVRLKLLSQLVATNCLEINRCSAPNFPIVCVLLQHCHGLEALSFTNTNEASPVLSELASSCTNLTNLNLDSSQRLDASAVMKVIRSCSRLTAINLNNTLLRSRDVMICMALHGRCLKEIIFREWIDVGILAFHGRTPLVSFTRRYQLSGTLALLWYRGAHSLTRLNVSKTKLSSYTMTSMAKACTELVDLDLSHCAVVLGESAVSCLTQLRRLNLLEAKGLTDETLILISSFCGQLEELHLACAQEVSALGVANISKLTALVSLSLTGMGLSIGEDNPLLQIVMRCPGIRELEISSNFELDDVTVVQVLSYCRGLTRVGVMKCRLLTDRTLEALSRFGDTLEMLNMGDNKQYTDNGVLGLLSQCSYLRRLGMSATNVTDASLKTICEHNYRRLAELDITFCPRIVYQSSYTSTIMKCKRLRRLATSYKDINSLLNINRKTNPDLNITYMHPALNSDD